MNSTITDVTHCQICFNLFGSKESCPRILYCGHTFCHSCLQRFISEGSVCPTCKNDIPFISADDIMINFCVKSFIETANKSNDLPRVMRDTLEAAAPLTNCKESFVANKSTKKIEFPYDGHCEKHFSPNHFKCIDCNKYICGTCALLIHSNCPKPLPVLEALSFMKGEKLKKIKLFKTKLEKEAKMLDSKLDHLNKKTEKLYQKIEIVEAEVKETKSKKERNQKLQEDSSCYKESLEKATCKEDYDKVDAKVKFFFYENCIENLLPASPSLASASLSLVLSKEEAMKLTRKEIEENTFYVMKSDNEAKKYAKVKLEGHQISFDKWDNEVEGGSYCVDFLDFINSRTTVIDTHNFIEEHKKELHNPRLPKDKIKFSQIEVKEKEVYFYSFQTFDEESDLVIEFGTLLTTLGCLSVVPTDAFLISEIYSGVGEFVIATDGRSPRAISFLLLASGIMNDSYQGTQSFKTNVVINGGYNRGGTLIRGVVETQDESSYESKTMKIGDVTGSNENHFYYLSLFRIWKTCNGSSSRTIFGRVKRGMEVVNQIREQEGHSLEECGLLFDLH